MKKLFSMIVVTGMLVLGMLNFAQAQGGETTIKKDSTGAGKNDIATSIAKTDTMTQLLQQASAAEEKSFHLVLKEKFIEGGAGWMTPILICFVLGLALVIERILYLTLARTNTQKLLEKVEVALEAKDINGAKEICRNTRGPVASVFYQGLERFNEDIDMIEKSIVSYGGVQMGRLESNLSWIGLFIALAPMLGFLGTVVGMVQAFDAIEKAGDISPTIVAGGMKVALLTTVFGLIVAIILQVLYNFIVSMVEKVVNEMEDSAISFMDLVYKAKKH